MLPQTSFFGGQPPLSQKIGYPLVILLAAFFAVFTVCLFQIDRWVLPFVSSC